MKKASTALLVGLMAATALTGSMAAEPPVTLSPNWSRAMPSGPDTRVKITEEYARQVGRDAYFWAWPMVNMYNRRLHFMQVKEMMLQGPLMEAPANRLAMLTDYIDPEERSVACPNQDVVYGVGALALDISPVVIQVPDFGDRFWVYQVVDLRTDSFVQLGKMYGTTPGFYLLVGPDWNGEVPKGITKVFRSSTNTGLAAPRVAQNDTPEDKRAIQSVLPGIMMYPVAEYDGRMKTKDWANLPRKACASRRGRGDAMGTSGQVRRRAAARSCRCGAVARGGGALRPGACGRGRGQKQSRDQAGDDRGRKGSGRETGEAAVPVPQLRAAASAQLVHDLQ